ncbi:MAG: MmgE/PrpD family protein [Spirochaetota bacterium]|nr:MmgE/PrpD family protein [Spirochaetota bacterium]
MNTTEKLADFVVNTKFDDIPAQGIRTAKNAMMDCTGCAFVGAKQEIGRIITDYVVDMGALPISTVIGPKLKTSPEMAAFANGIMAHAEDFDDICVAVLGHPSVPLFPAILSLGEMLKASGRELIEAYVIGLEVAARIGIVLNGDHYARGWHGTSTTGTIGAAAASARLLKLDARRVRTAMGMAASQTAGLRQNFGTMTKPFHAGNAARSGVTSAMLAKRGFTADQDILEAPLGFFQVYRGNGFPPLESIVENLGKTFEIVKTGIAFKLYSSCAETHSAIEIMLNMVQEHNLKQEDIKEIVCSFNNMMNSVMLHHNPQTGLEAKFSVEYCIARALRDGKLMLDDFTDSRVNEQEIKNIIDRIVINIDDEIPFFATKIDVESTNGTKLSKRIELPRGYPNNPLSQVEMVEKYRGCASLLLSKDNIDKSVSMFDNLEDVKDISELMKIIC